MYLLALAACVVAVIVGALINPTPIVFVGYGIISPILSVLPRLVYRASIDVRKRITIEWIRMVEFFTVLCILVNAPGSLYLHGAGIQYDRFLHFIAAGLSFFLFLMFTAPLEVSKRGKLTKRWSVRAAFIATFFGLFIWEGYQFIMDQTFATNLFHDVVQDIRRDVTEDIIFGFFGMSLAAWYSARNAFWKRLERSVIVNSEA